MTDVHGTRTTRLLPVVLGVILAVEGALVLAHGITQHGGMHVVAFGGIELVSALLFLWPRTRYFGACGLVCASLGAAVVHFAEGGFPSEHLVAAVAVLIAALPGVPPHGPGATA